MGDWVCEKRSSDARREAALMSDDWDDYADDWNDNEGVIIYANHTYETLIDEVDLSGLNILDFGCGTGNLTEKMAVKADKVLAIDSSAKMISILKNKNIKNIQALKSDLSQGDILEKFDLITASSVFGFVPDFAASLKILKNLLKPNGTVVQWDWLGTGQDDFGFSPEQLQSAYSKAGFKMVKISQPFSLNKSEGEKKVVMSVARI